MRLFIAINLPEGIKEYLSQIQEYLKKDTSQDDRINWVNTKNMHLTLKFLGEVNEKKAEDVKEKLRTVNAKKMQLTLSNMGGFPENKQIRVVWVGAAEEEPLFELHKLIDFSLSKYFPAEREFKGHMTLGRVKNIKDAESFLRQMKTHKINPHTFSVEKFALVQSKLSPKGPEYTVLEEYRLSD